MSLIQMSISGAIMILAVIVIRALAINRLPKKTFIALWGIILLRLLVPFSFPSPFSAYSLVNQHIFTPQDAVGLENANVIPAPPVDLPTTGDVVIQGQTTANISPYAIIWGIGLIVCALFFSISYFKCRREFQESLPIKNDFLTLWIAKHKLSRPIEIRQSSRISAPLTYGVFKPIILMPKSTKWEDAKQIEYILAHEFVHVRRFDAAVKLLLTAALCIHWFNPLVWAMYILFNRDIELSCDETVVRSFGETTKSTYALTLISMEEKKSALTPLCNSFSKNAIEERITAIMKMKKTSVVAILVATALIVGVTAAFATSAATSDKSLAVIPNTDFAQNGNNQLLDKETLEIIASEVEKSIAPYVPFGITYKLDAEGQAKFYWNGTRIRGIYDEVTGTWVSNSAGNSTFDVSVKELFAVYTDQKLTGLRVATAQEQEEWNNIRNQNSNKPIQISGKAIAAGGKISLGSQLLAAGTDCKVLLTFTGDSKLTVLCVSTNRITKSLLVESGKAATLQIEADGEYTISVKNDNSYTIDNVNGTIEFMQSLGSQSSNILTSLNASTSQTVTYSNVEMRRYEGTDGHPYIHDTKVNETAKKIIGYKYGMLAFDKDGNPLKIDWWSLDTEAESTYFYLDETSTEIAPAETYDLFGGWSLNYYGTDSSVKKIAYVLYSDKEITFEDGTIWTNPNFDSWRSTYEGKKVDVKILKGYYPYEQTINFAK